MQNPDVFRCDLWMRSKRGRSATRAGNRTLAYAEPASLSWFQRSQIIGRTRSRKRAEAASLCLATIPSFCAYSRWRKALAMEESTSRWS